MSIIFRRVGKRKAAVKADKGTKRPTKKELNAKKDPNRPKRPPSAFFVFLFVSILSRFVFQLKTICLISFKTITFLFV